MLGWIGNIFIIIGILMVAYKMRSGFLFGCIGNTLWLAKGVITDQYDLIAIEALIVILQAFSWWNWRNVGTTNSIHSGSTE